MTEKQIQEVLARLMYSHDSLRRSANAAARKGDIGRASVYSAVADSLVFIARGTGVQ